jgi:hypothetical protein
LVAGPAYGAGIGRVERRATGCHIVPVVDLVGHAEAARPALLGTGSRRIGGSDVGSVARRGFR